MQHLFSPQGEAALAAALRRRPLLAFDFDGTLAPIVARPESARISRGVSTRLSALNAQLPVAIVTGRTVADVRTRLDFSPSFVIGNHGAEDEIGAAARLQPAAELTLLHEALRGQGQALDALGVTVEDKRLSIALHYRLSRQREQALALIQDLLAPFAAELHVFAGKMVVNVSPANAPDKADAVHALVARCGADCAVFAGDDVNDEPVFASAPADWLTVRVGRDDPHSRARYFLDGPNEVALMLEHMLSLLPSAQHRR
ncbi:MAG: trehalose-phosphatase [Burkholderiaceae bacterium]|nr:trehalose-phosphatase [Burkholderiaceae bacterium]